MAGAQFGRLAYSAAPSAPGFLVPGRTLGRMILAAREAGDLASEGQHVSSSDTRTALADLGLHHDGGLCGAGGTYPR